jgi:hypothetical protein
MRFFHRSPRLSEDIKIDVLDQIEPDTLHKTISLILESAALFSHLATQGILGVTVTPSKQTAKTLNFAVTLQLPEEPLQTQIELNLRSDKIEYETGIPNPEMLSRYKSIPFAAQFYNSNVMVEQKIEALTTARRGTVRDLFDLHYLIGGGKVDLTQVVNCIGKKEWASATERIKKFSFKSFVEQVRPYLTEEQAATYNDISCFSRMKNETADTLLAHCRKPTRKKQSKNGTRLISESSRLLSLT